MSHRDGLDSALALSQDRIPSDSDLFLTLFEQVVWMGLRVPDRVTESEVDKPPQDMFTFRNCFTRNLMQLKRLVVGCWIQVRPISARDWPVIDLLRCSRLINSALSTCDRVGF